MKKKSNKEYAIKRRFIIWLALLFLATLCLFSAKWYIDTYGDVGFDAIIFSLMANVSGTEASIVWNFIYSSLIPAIASAILLWLLIFYRTKVTLNINFIKNHKCQVYPFSNFISRALCIIVSFVMIGYALLSCGLFSYIKAISDESQLYQTTYVKPTSSVIQFPEQKQNLIYIYAESMETTFFSTKHGGVFEEDIIPELYKLAKDNINFSQNEEVGGGRATYGTTWTAGAMVAQTSGAPLKLPVSIDGTPYTSAKKYLPGLRTLSDVLHENDYYQALMVGSDSHFGNRYEYYTQHGTDKVYDLATAPKDGIIPEGYKVWWGFEDKYLFKYAKQELPQIAAKGKPFAFTMLTVDTHFPDGYTCDLCEDKYDEPYNNVYACSSRQIVSFVKWIMEQDFYKNTTIIISGDHPTMDERYASDNIPKDTVRRVYNCIINSRVNATNNKNREFTTLDMFPTTLAAMGCKIEGDRLGLGTNLFSGKETLCEEYEFDKLCYEVSRTSLYYNKRFLHNYKN